MDNSHLEDYLKEDLMELENQDLMKTSSFSQKGGGNESLPFDMTNINEMGQNLLSGSGSNSNLTAQGGSMSSSLMNTDRPNFPALQHQQQQSGGTVEPPKSDIKIINLDVDYKMKEQDAFSQSSQSGGEALPQPPPNTQQQAGSSNTIKPIDPKGFIPIADNMKPTFESEIFI